MQPLGLTILKNAAAQEGGRIRTNVLSFEELKARLNWKWLWTHLGCYDEVCLRTARLDALSHPFLTAVLLRLLSLRACAFEDVRGNRQAITLRLLGGFGWQYITDILRRPCVLRRIRRDVACLQLPPQTAIPSPDWSASPVYLRTELEFGHAAGGFVAHIAGVLNQLDRFVGKPIFLTTDPIPTVRSDIESFQLMPPQTFRDFAEVWRLAFNTQIEQQARVILAHKRLAFLYQRYSLNTYAGVRLARHYKIPFILEYNGSEVWITQHWVKPLRYKALSEQVEAAILNAADLIVVVSQVLQDELVSRGIERAKVVVIPNGVDTEQYSPQVDGAAIRQQYRLEGKTSVGFIGTFGRWHGAEVLVEAFGRLVRDCPAYGDYVRLFLVGDGKMMAQVKQLITTWGLEDVCILTGLVPQAVAPSYLATCDIYVAPHVPNPDGSPFFGSPTKVFEYMAMGKGIVASQLGQIGDVLEHDRTAWFVPPGDCDGLKDGLKVLIDDPQRRDRLGQAARQEVMAKYTWVAHTRQIIEKLKERCG